jgi:hypothetical protein
MPEESGLRQVQIVASENPVYRYLTAVTRSRLKCFRAKKWDEVS